MQDGNAAPVEEQEPDNYETMKAAALRDLLDERGITGVERRSKLAMIEALRQADAAEGEAADEEPTEEEEQACAEPEEPAQPDLENLSEPGKIEHCDRFLPVPYTPEELAEIAEELVEATQKARQLEEHKRDVSKSLTDQINGKREEAAKAAADYKRGTKDAYVDVEQHFHYPERIVTFWRMDTGERYSWRAMLDSERQTELETEPEQPEETAESFPGDDGEGAQPED